MRALTACLAFVLSIGLLANVSNANVTISKQNTAAQTFSANGSGGFSASGVKSVSFTSADFNNHPTAEILAIEVTVSFTKLQGPGAGDLSPYYNEIRMEFTKTGGPSTVLINNGPLAGAADSFSQGLFAGANQGFDGTVRFSNTATTAVNAVGGAAPTNTIPNSTVTNTAYRPAGATAAWTSFLGQSAIGTFNLNLADIDVGAGDVSVDPLVFRSMTVTITAVPEPSTFGLCGLLTLGGAFIRRRSRA